MRQLGRADQREIVFERQRKDNAAVPVLKSVGIAGAADARHDDMASLDQPDDRWRSAARTRNKSRDVANPRSRSVDDGARPDAMLLRAQRHDPEPVLDFEPANRRPRQDRRASFARGDGVEHDEARIVDPAVPVGKAVLQVAKRAARQPDRLGDRSTAMRRAFSAGPDGHRERARRASAPAAACRRREAE